MVQELNNLRPYRLNVGICLFNKAGKVFVGERSDTPGAWQMPQGGIDDGEDIERAALRELYEETGINQVEILHILKQDLQYDFPPHLTDKPIYREYRGQRQKWVAMRFLGSDSDINLLAHPEAEFAKWQWIDLDKTLDLIVPFKREVYKSIIQHFSNLPIY